jgi:ATP-dependent exoDNAse (exonuclease V) alpha subunit
VPSQAHADEGIVRVEARHGFLLSEEQRELVRGVLADPAAVSLVRAVAGSGKTTTLAAIAQAYEHAGIPVAGVAPTGAAARVMSEAGIPARTVERALLEREHAIRAGIRPTPGIVLVDEAGTIGTRTLARLAQAVALADAKLVLVGDDAQLPAVAAGTTYSDLLEQGKPVHTLETPRRFVTQTGEPDLAEARALARLRAGTLDGAAAYLEHKHRTGSVEALDRRAALESAAAWHAEQVAAGVDPTRIALIARSNALRDLLNQRARASMRDSGLLGPDIAGIAQMPLAVGDVVVCRQDNPRLGTTNGARGRITSITTSELTLATSDQRSLVLPHAYGREGSLEHAYAITGHLAQAATFDAAMVVAPAHHHTQQWSYTALSRSRTPTRLVILTETARDQPAEHASPLDPIDARDALTRLATCMTRDESETDRRSPTQLPAPTRAAPRHAHRSL